MERKTDYRDLSRVFRALSVDSRVRIVQLLAERTLCVGALSNLLGISAGAVSQHLRILKDAGLVESDRRGYFIHYRLAPGAAKCCQVAMFSLFGPRRGDKRCAAEGRSTRGRKN